MWLARSDRIPVVDDEVEFEINFRASPGSLGIDSLDCSVLFGVAVDT